MEACQVLSSPLLPTSKSKTHFLTWHHGPLSQCSLKCRHYRGSCPDTNYSFRISLNRFSYLVYISYPPNGAKSILYPSAAWLYFSVLLFCFEMVSLCSPDWLCSLHLLPQPHTPHYCLSRGTELTGMNHPLAPPVQLFRFNPQKFGRMNSI